jgi:DNA-binding FadR family transcriptional regulator
MLHAIPRRVGATSACAAQLRDAILRGELQVGERLPPERSLAVTLGVNRATVRAALHELEASGLVTARQGSGYAVHDYLTSGGPDLLAPLADLAREEGRLVGLAAELLSVRRHLARAVLERLAAWPPGEVALGEALARVDALAALAARRAPPVELVRGDVAVLAALLDATGSPVLRLFLNPAAAALAHVPELGQAMMAEPALNVAAWRGLLAALAGGALAVEATLAGLAALDAATLARLARITPRGARRGAQ